MSPLSGLHSKSLIATLKNKEDTMEKWEYLTEFAWANIDTKGVREYLKQRWPDWTPRQYTPESMIPLLNDRGKEGWELVHMEPVRQVGKNQDIKFQSGGEISSTDWSNVYFCVFKRRVP
jgi:hypothetical protein